MTEHVTGTNVGKMTEKKAIHEIELMEQMECACPDCERRRPALQMAIEALQFQQEIVRCKDCKWYVKEDGIDILMCFHSLRWPKETDFCSSGEWRNKNE